jgi:hypothetical protein
LTIRNILQLTGSSESAYIPTIAPGASEEQSHFHGSIAGRNPALREWAKSRFFAGLFKQWN